MKRSLPIPLRVALTAGTVIAIGFAFVTLVAGVLISPLFFAVHLLADAALGGFVWMLIEHRNRAYEQRTTRDLRAVPEVAPIQRRRASGS